MRLLKTDTFKIEEFAYGHIPKYAILSHRWSPYELTLQDVQGRIWEEKGFDNERAKLKAFKKMEQCCFKAKDDSYEYVWIDSCCIDKTSSAELSEAINSMYRWYYKAAKCYAYLADVPSSSTLENSEWFKRGWTLQELLAPSKVHFLSEDWKELGTKKGLRKTISICTGIPIDILSGAGLETASIAQRMSWASRRKTTRIEDCAYCLMGIFGINMPLLYGEGRSAFIRLQEEILRISDDQSLFAWKSLDSRGGLLATSPYAFIDSNNIVPLNPSHSSGGPPFLSSRGIHLDLRFVVRGSGGLGMVIFHCIARGKVNKHLAIYVKDTTLTMEKFERVGSEVFEWVNLSRFPISRYPLRNICIKAGRVSTASKCDNLGSRDNITKHLFGDEELAILMDNADPTMLFHAAAANRHFHVWLLLTRNDVNPNWKDSQGRTVLWFAAMQADEVVAKMLLARSDVDVDSVDYEGQTPLFLATELNKEAMVKLLVDSGADLEAKDKQGRTPISVAAARSLETMVKLLREAGADIEAEVESGTTLLAKAAADGDLALAKLLLENGADIDSKKFDHKTPLWAAARHGHVAIVELLLENGANIESKDILNETPVWAAVRTGRATIVKLLLEAGANPYGTNERGQTLLRLAVESGRHVIINLLRAADM